MSKSNPAFNHSLHQDTILLCRHHNQAHSSKVKQEGITVLMKISRITSAWKTDKSSIKYWVFQATEKYRLLIPSNTAEEYKKISYRLIRKVYKTFFIKTST